MLSNDGFRATAALIPNADTARHTQLLYGLVKWLTPLTIVEVGAFHGHSSVWMARALQENNAGNLYIIDDFSLAETYEKLLVNIGACHVADRIKLIRGNSREVQWPDRIDLAFIDGDHSYEGCKADVETAVSKGAMVIVVHDTTGWWGPRKWSEQEQYPDYSRIEAIHDSGLVVMMRQPLKPPVRFSEEKYPSGAIESSPAREQPRPTTPAPLQLVGA